MNLYISALNSSITEEDLRLAFEKFGKLKRVFLAKDKVTNDSLCYGFVEFENKSDGVKALSMNAQNLNGSDIRVSIAKTKTSSPFGGKKFGRK